MDKDIIDECEGFEDPYRQFGISGDTSQIWIDCKNVGIRHNKYVTTLDSVDVPLNPKRKQISRKLKVELVRERGGLCEVCESDVYHHIHHIDGNCSNNVKSNLQLICIDCHKRKHGGRSLI